MALFIRDEAVERLASEVQQVLKTKTKKEAVRLALEHELERAQPARPLRKSVATLEAKIARAQAMADKLGPGDPNFDMKAYMDEMWGDDD
jgi:antitoxin VapB